MSKPTGTVELVPLMVEARPPVVEADAAGNSGSDFRASKFADKNELALWFPQIHSDESNDMRIWLSRRSRTLVVQIILIATILFTNFGLTVFAVSQYGSSNGVGLIYDGDCDTVRALDLWTHLLINLLSTGMLSASNYCMQLQAAPTRANVERAHNDGKWLDIGVPSLRNLRYISIGRALSWALLAFSSVPVHLMYYHCARLPLSFWEDALTLSRYNSAVFQSLSSNDYTIAVVKDSFETGSSWSLATAEANRKGDVGWDESRVNPPELDYTVVIQGMQDAVANGDYDELDVSACFRLYDDYWAPQGNAVILIANQSVQMPPDDSLLMYVSVIPRSDNWAKNMWALGNGTGNFVAMSPDYNVTKWYLGPKQYEVKSCLVQPPEDIAIRCRFEYCPPIMFAICALNLIKASVMLFTWAFGRWQQSNKQEEDKEILYTLGDAIASFMRHPEPRTENMCLATNRDFTSRRSWKNRLVKAKPKANTEARPFRKERKLWMAAASPRRWFILLFTCLLVIVVASILLSLGLTSLAHRRISTKLSSLWDLGFGALNPFTYLVIGLPREDPAGLVSNVILANLPQLVLSVLYVLLNAMLSTMLVQREFSRMSSTRKPLRVSEPLGIQRSSYFISLPLRYGIPLYATAALMHWLVSQSLFLARITAMYPEGTVDVRNSFSTCGASPIAVFIIALAILLAIVLLGCRRYDGTMRMHYYPTLQKPINLRARKHAEYNVDPTDYSHIGVYLATIRRLQDHKRHRSEVFVYRRQGDEAPFAQIPTPPQKPVVHISQPSGEDATFQRPKRRNSFEDASDNGPANDLSTTAGAGDASPVKTPEPRRFHLSRPDAMLSASEYPIPTHGGVLKKRSAPALFVERRIKRLASRPLEKLQSAPSTATAQDVAPTSEQNVPGPQSDPSAPGTADVGEAEHRKYKKPGVARLAGKGATPKAKTQLPQSMTNRWNVDMDRMAEEMNAFALEQIGLNLQKAEEEQKQRLGSAKGGQSNSQLKYKPKPPTKRYSERHPEPAPERTSESADKEMADADVGLSETDDEEYVIETYVRVPASKMGDNVPPQNVGLLVFDEEPDIAYFYGEGSDSEDEWAEDEEDENAENYYTADYPDDEVASDDEYDMNAYAYRTGNASDLEEYDMEDEYDDPAYDSDDVKGGFKTYIGRNGFTTNHL
ncbi:hypothetical protein DL770_001199 [Monosporascus sp. CRB-9-2]|nr:hypothetical protein DL770_001199 [Monosporascus sp. CRB-9-2]